jgi:hypothetical protein
MRVQYFEPNQLPKPSVEFRNSFDAYLNLCEFKEEEKLGILFYLGAIVPGRINSVDALSEEYSQHLQVLTLYSKSTGDFSDYGDLNDGYFSEWIYNANLAISKIMGDKNPIDENLRTLPNSTVIVGKANPINDFLDIFEEKGYNLNAVQNLNDVLFSKTGLHLKEKNYSYSRAYEAGFAYRFMMMQMDVKGTSYLLSRINSFLSPLYQTLFYTPFLYIFNPDAFKANHLFSQILNTFYGGQDSKLFPIAQSIHIYHQHVFYKEKSTELKDFWKFNQKSDEGSAILVFHNAINIHKTNLKQNSNLIKLSGEVFDKKLIDAKISTNDFLNAILHVIQSKYSNGVLFKEFIDGWNAKWNNGWNNKGEYIQFLVILFYETCLHALVTEEIEEV